MKSLFVNMVKGLVSFFRISIKNDIYILASDLTLKIIVSSLPFLMFLVAVLGSLDLNLDTLIDNFQGNIPTSIINVFVGFMESIESKGSSAGLISSTLFFAVLSASSGFISVNRGIARIYNVTDTRNYIVRRSICFLQVILFTLSIIFSLIAIIFGDVIFEWLKKFEVLPLNSTLIYDTTTKVIVFTTMVLMIMLIYSVGHKKIKFFTTIPGAVFTVVFWFISSKGYNLYINNYSSYSAVYGALGTVLIFVFWVNIISIVLLFGCQINALIYEHMYVDDMNYKTFFKELKNSSKNKFKR